VVRRSRRDLSPPARLSPAPSAWCGRIPKPSGAEHAQLHQTRRQPKSEPWTTRPRGYTPARPTCLLAPGLVLAPNHHPPPLPRANGEAQPLACASDKREQPWGRPAAAGARRLVFVLRGSQIVTALAVASAAKAGPACYSRKRGPGRPAREARRETNGGQRGFARRAALFRLATFPLGS
jgi:hypothetical protein